MKYQIKHAIVQYAANVILEDVNFEVHENEKIAIVGRNGCGKTTLLKLIAGDIEMSNLDSDEECGIFMEGKQEIGFLRQISFENGEITVEDEIKKALTPVFECEARMAEIEYKKIKRYLGNYSAFIKRKEENLVKQEKDYELQQKEIERLTEWIEKWKNTPTKVSATRSKRMAIEHMDKVEKPVRFDAKSFHALFEPNRESYNDVIIAKKLKIGYDEVLSEVTFSLHKKERIAILGENGKGKSPLLR